jgi:branched-chain amino acid transport system ATP-binding protein
MLTVNKINVFYDAIHAIHDVSFHVDEGEIVTLIGANGAGKTTIMQTISGLLKARSGEITFLGQDLRRIEPHKIVELGLAQVPERRRIFTQLTVQENLEMGAYIRKDKENLNADYEAIFKRFPRLQERRRQHAGTLSGGEQQMLAIGRALMSKPKLLLMDEPSMGLSPLLVQEIFRIIRDVRDSGMTVLLVEQNAQMALSIADRAYVLETGSVAIQGNAHDMLGNDEVKRAYLGI